MTWQTVAIVLGSLAVFVMLVWAGVMLFAWRSMNRQSDTRWGVPLRDPISADRWNWRQTERRGPGRKIR